VSYAIAAFAVTCGVLLAYALHVAAATRALRREISGSRPNRG
jgi:hypothetical protein